MPLARPLHHTASHEPPRPPSAQARKWQHSGFMQRRGLALTWIWTKDYFVLCDDVLYQFADGSLDATIVDA